MDPTAAADQTGVVLLRVWMESGDVIRGRLITVADAGRPSPMSQPVGSVAQACDLIREWLTDFERGAPWVRPPKEIGDAPVTRWE